MPELHAYMSIRTAAVVQLLHVQQNSRSLAMPIAGYVISVMLLLAIFIKRVFLSHPELLPFFTVS